MSHADVTEYGAHNEVTKAVPGTVTAEMLSKHLQAIEEDLSSEQILHRALGDVLILTTRKV